MESFARAGLPPPGAEDTATAPTRQPEASEPMSTHHDLMSLLGAWALSACSPEEAERVEAHLTDCGRCAEEALRLREAVTFLEPQRSLDLDPRLRVRVLEGCLTRRPAAVPVPPWAAPLDAEAARLDALLNDMAEDEWRATVELRWFEDDRWHVRATTVAGVLDHLLAVDGLLARTVGLPDPLAGDGDDDGPVPGPLPVPVPGHDPVARTLARWRAAPEPRAEPRAPWLPWREQTRALVRAAAGRRETALPDDYLGRAFACWVHAGDIAAAVEYPYGPPYGAHLRLLVDLAARRLPGSIAGRRRAGLATSPGRLTTAGATGRTIHLEVEGAGGGHWYIPLDSPTAAVARTETRSAVAHVALDDVVFCQLAAGRITPEEAASGGEGDPAVIRDVLFAAAALSRL
ncbi:zf-HC2 domain-containing protein [Streptomyces sp. NBC_01803]|uniref:zf-HC2 domain-containing protein n=1 Tax=Streptomyces sp. NBC_01803 TaxID=2975946 RepID=UPI002DDB1622|nr:zf-HC2 domain-containing protein [Streptomyces sp. NBC_01803]WSA44736.1 zf-HC2 domain-containing protein [Streptomyces sp. NBC_01803]